MGLLKDFKPNGHSENRFFRVSGSARWWLLATVGVGAASLAKAGLLYFWDSPTERYRRYFLAELRMNSYSTRRVVATSIGNHPCATG